MKFQFDKEMLKKHHFWVVLAGSFVVAIGAVVLIMTSVSAGIHAEKAKVEKDLKALIGRANKPVYTKAQIASMRNKADGLEKLEDDAHRKAFEWQEGMIRWSPNMEKTFKYTRHESRGEIGRFARKITVLAEGADIPNDLESAPDIDEGLEFKGKVTSITDLHITVKGPAKTYTAPKRVGGKLVKQDEARLVSPVPELTFLYTHEVTKVVGEDGADKDFRNISRDALVSIKYEHGRYFNDRFTEKELETYASSYHEQFEEILEQVDPITDTGSGVVQLLASDGKYWPYKRGTRPAGAQFIQIVDAWKPNVDFSEEAWLAQESIWVYREIYRMIDQANGYVRIFEPDKKAPKTKGKFVGQNAYWRLEMEIKDGKGVSFTLKNLLPRRQRLDIALRVAFKDGGKLETIPVGGGAPALPRGTKETTKDGESISDSFTKEVSFKDLGLDDSVSRTHIYAVEQQLSWDIAAVKRVDEVIVGAKPGATSLSHRAFVQPLREYKAVAPPPPVEGPPPDGPEGPKRLPPGREGPGPGGPGGDVGEVTGHGFAKKRYLEVSPQVRRIPIVVVLIADQEHVDRVQTSFANSKFRFLTKQVLLSHYPSTLDPNLNATPPLVPGVPGRTEPPIRPPGPPGPMVFPPGPGPIRPFPEPPFGRGPGDGFTPPPAVNEEAESNIEMVIYGVVTLYERHPKRAAEEKTE